MVFAHGFGCDQAMWRHVAPSFEASHRVVLFDQVGAGGSDTAAYDAQRYDSLDQYAADLLDICDALELTDAVFVGHSVAAMIGLLAAIRAPRRFARLVMVSPSPCYLNDGAYRGGMERSDIDDLLAFLDDNAVAWSHTMAPLIMGNPERPQLGKELQESFCRVDPTIARQFARVTFLSDTRSALGTVPCPSLILQCSQDAIAAEPVGRYLHAAMPASTLVNMAATGHCPNMSAPAETIDAMRAWLA